MSALACAIEEQGDEKRRQDEQEGDAEKHHDRRHARAPAQARLQPHVERVGEDDDDGAGRSTAVRNGRRMRKAPQSTSRPRRAKATMPAKCHSRRISRASGALPETEGPLAVAWLGAAASLAAARAGVVGSRAVAVAAPLALVASGLAASPAASLVGFFGSSAMRPFRGGPSSHRSVAPRTIAAMLLRRLLLRVLLTLLAAAGFPLAAAAEGPLAIHSPGLRVPEETAGSGVAPEAAVKISIDARGAVTHVEVVSITPSTEQDEYFRRDLVKTLLQWRFAPATKDGKPEPSTLEWRVRFPAKPRQVTDSIDVTTSPLPGADAEQRRSQVLALPQEQRRKLLEAQATTALRFLDAKRREDVSTPRFVVHCDADDRKVAATVGNNLEVIFNVLETELLSGIRLSPRPYKMQVFVYRDRASYVSSCSRDADLRILGRLLQPCGNDRLPSRTADQRDRCSTSCSTRRRTPSSTDTSCATASRCRAGWAKASPNTSATRASTRGRLQPGKTMARQFASSCRARSSRVADRSPARGSTKPRARSAEGKGLRRARHARRLARHLLRREAFALLRLVLAARPLPARRRRRAGRASAFRSSFSISPRAIRRRRRCAPLYGPPESADEAFRKYVKGF